MKKIVPKKKTRFFTIVLLCLFALAAVILPAASAFAEAKAIHPWITQEPWTGEDGGGGGGDPDEISAITTYVYRGYENELSYLPLQTNGNNIGDNDYYTLESEEFVNQKVSRPTPSTDYNGIDYVIYMIGELGDLAREYIVKSGREYTMVECNDLILGYIRGINTEYYSHYINGASWSMVAGSIPPDFITYVRDNDEPSGGTLSLAQFFASFLQDAGLYNTLYGTIDSSYLNKHYLLPDPLGSGQSIDLIHMFAAMDGIYKRTGQLGTLGVNDNLTGEIDGAELIGLPLDGLVSWLGDLQTFAKELKYYASDIFRYKTYDSSMGHVDFTQMVNNASYAFSSSDLLADVDAMNMVKFYLDNNFNSVAKVLATYYSETPHDDAAVGNRYHQFIYTSTVQNGSGSSDPIASFQSNVFTYMNLKYENGNISDSTNYNTDSFLSSLVIDLMIEDGQTPPAHVRSYCAKLFYEYITIMSRRA